MVLVKSFLQIIVFGKPCCVNTNLILTENFYEISIHTTMQCHMHLLSRIFPDSRLEWYLSSSWLMCPGLYFLLQEVDSWQTLAARSIEMMDHPPTHPVETLISTVVLPVLTFVWQFPQKFPCESIALLLICLKETSSPYLLLHAFILYPVSNCGFYPVQEGGVQTSLLPRIMKRQRWLRRCYPQTSVWNKIKQTPVE